MAQCGWDSVTVDMQHGAQDFQTSDNVYQWHFGADLHLEIRDFDQLDTVVERLTRRWRGAFPPIGSPCTRPMPWNSISPACPGRSGWWATFPTTSPPRCFSI